MRWPRRTTRLPAEARAALALGHRERVLAAAVLSDGSWVVATDQGMVQGGWRVAWSSTTHAQWYADTETLSLTWLDDSGDTHETNLVLGDPGRLPEAVYERVTASILLSRRVTTADGHGMRVVARRQPGSEEVLWQVVPDAGTDLSSAEALARIDVVMRTMADELGL